MPDLGFTPAAAVTQARLVARLAACNARWERRAAAFRRTTPPPWWAPGLILDAAVRDAYERQLPVRTFLDDLHDLAALLLPDPAWIPAVLHAVGGCGCGGGTTTITPPSLPDLWQELPEPLAGRVVFRADELLPLLCALADPPRFGTDFGRYPEQLATVVTANAALPDRDPLRLLDLGCGTGQGTWELAAALVGARPGPPVVALGITREPLEAWMATTRRLPHDPTRERRYRQFAPPVEARVAFAAGDALAPPCRGSFDVVVANGLVGGRFLRTPQALARFFRGLRTLVAPGGVASFANRFHAGERPGVAAAMAAAAAAGWRVEGTPSLWHATAATGTPRA